LVSGYLEILAPGLLTTVQDTRGRLAFVHLGVRAGGAMDTPAAVLANRLVGNPPDAAVLEVTLVGPRLRMHGSPRVVAITGADLSASLAAATGADVSVSPAAVTGANASPSPAAVRGANVSASLDGIAVAPGRGVLVQPGSTLSFGDRRAGLRAYIALSGGIDVPPVLGSRSTDLLSGFGGLEGRALRAGDRLPLGARHDRGGAEGEPTPLDSDRSRRGGGVDQVRLGWGSSVAGRYVVPAWQPPDPAALVRILPGPHVDRFAPGALEALCASPWQITERADRMGYRLAGGSLLRHVQAADVPSLGLPGGAIQVPADGQPIVLLADHQPTGGYTVLATVIHADLPILAQRGPGETVQFAQTTPSIARTILRAQHAGPTLAGDEGEFAASWA
jgi:antagonist of KipI